MAKSETVRNAERLVEVMMKDNDASHDAAHVFRVRDLALSLAHEEGLSSSPISLEIVELAALLHDIGDYKYLRNASEDKIVEDFLEKEGVDMDKSSKILSIIKEMGFKEEIGGIKSDSHTLEFGVVQDADRLDAIGAIGIARCFTFGGSRNRVLHDPNIQPRSDLSKDQYMNKNEQTTVNHFHEKLLKLKDLMKTKSGKKRAEKRHKFMEEFLKEFYQEWAAKWCDIPLVGCQSQSTTKRPKPNESMGSANVQINLDDDEDVEGQHDRDGPRIYYKPDRPTRKGKRSAASSSLHEDLIQQMAEFNSFNKKESQKRIRLREEKLRVLQEEKDARIQLMRRQQQALDEQQKTVDLEFIMKDHTIYQEPMLQLILDRKREIAAHWGWQCPF